MNWKHKAGLMAILSAMPFGDQIHYFIQRHVVKSLPSSTSSRVRYMRYAGDHLVAITRNLNKMITEAKFYEFGVGRELIGPVTFHSEGAWWQDLSDVEPLKNDALVANTLSWFPTAVSVAWNKLQPAYNGRMDPAKTNYGTGTFDFITTTNVLEHIPAVDLPAILAECHRILKDDGVMSMRIDYDDHYSKVDPSISPWNFLKYSEKQWARYNSRLHYQNRLQHLDYLSLFAQAGFLAVEEHIEGDQGWIHNAQIVLTKGDNHG